MLSPTLISKKPLVFRIVFPHLPFFLLKYFFHTVLKDIMFSWDHLIASPNGAVMLATVIIYTGLCPAACQLAEIHSILTEFLFELAGKSLCLLHSTAVCIQCRKKTWEERVNIDQLMELWTCWSNQNKISAEGQTRRLISILRNNTPAFNPCCSLLFDFSASR